MVEIAKQMERIVIPKLFTYQCHKIFCLMIIHMLHNKKDYKIYPVSFTKIVKQDVVIIHRVRQILTPPPPKKNLR